jgi:hypothetical protein
MSRRKRASVTDHALNVKVQGGPALDAKGMSGESVTSKHGKDVTLFLSTGASTVTVSQSRGGGHETDGNEQSRRGRSHEAHADKITESAAETETDTASVPVHTSSCERSSEEWPR